MVRLKPLLILAAPVLVAPGLQARADAPCDTTPSFATSVAPSSAITGGAPLPQSKPGRPAFRPLIAPAPTAPTAAPKTVASPTVASAPTTLPTKLPAVPLIMAAPNVAAPKVVPTPRVVPPLVPVGTTTPLAHQPLVAAGTETSPSKVVLPAPDTTKVNTATVTKTKVDTTKVTVAPATSATKAGGGRPAPTELAALPTPLKGEPVKGAPALPALGSVAGGVGATGAVAPDGVGGMTPRTPSHLSSREAAADQLLLARLDAKLAGAEHSLNRAQARLTEGQRQLGAFTDVLRAAMLEAGPDARGLHPFVRVAQRYLGTPYVWGGESARGFDCSGFIMRVMRDLGYKALPHSAAEQFRYGMPILKAALKPGDIVFFANTYKPGISHVGIYLGHGRFIHAANSHVGTIVSSLGEPKWIEHYAGARRLIPART